MKHFIFSLIVLSVCSSIIRSQSDSASYILPEFRLYQNSIHDADIYSFSKDYNKLILYNDTLFADPSVYKYKVSLNNIDQVSFRDGTNVVPGFLYAAAGGFLLGFIAGVTSPKDVKSEGHPGGPVINGGLELGFILGFVSALGFGAVGALLGLVMPYYEDYVLNKTDISKKRSGLKKVFNFWKVQKK